MRSQLARDVVARLQSVVLGIVLLALGGCQIPPDVLALPRSVHDFFTRPRSERVLLISQGAAGGAAEPRVLLDDLHLPHGIELVDGPL